MRPTYVPLNEEHPRISGATLAQAGVLHPGRVSYWGWKNIADAPSIRVTGGTGSFTIADGSSEVRVVLRTGFMVCPSCERLCRYLLRRDGWKCRTCSGTDYAIRRTWRMNPAVHHRRRILRQLARIDPLSLKAVELERKLRRVNRAIVQQAKNVRKRLGADRRRRPRAASSEA